MRKSTTPLLAAMMATLLPVALLAGLTILEPEDGAVVPTHTTVQKSLLTMPLAERKARFSDPDFRRSMTERGKDGAYGWHPLPTRIRWSGSSGPVKVSVRRGKGEAEVFAAESSTGEVLIDNLEIACDYVIRIASAEGSTESRFRTEDEAPRLLRSGKVPNVRDLGGRMGMDGRRVRQNLVFRSAGLNENARTIYSTRETWGTMDTNGLVAAHERRIAESVERWRAYAKDPSGFALVDARLPKNWNFWLKEGLETIDAMKVLFDPMEQTWTGVIGMDGKASMDFNAVGEGRWVLLEGIVLAESDGYVPVGCGADWYWMMTVNGEIVRDLLTRGNRVPTVDVTNHFILLPVRKGENVVRILIGSGSGGCRLAIGGVPMMSREKMAARECEAQVALLENLYVRTLRRELGRTRIDDDGRAFWLSRLGIKSDIDLRSDRECYGMTGSPLGAGVRWFHYASSAYAGMNTESAKAAFANVFRVFLDAKNYPIDFHCISGQDRTGTVAFILNGLLGVSENELYLDWESTIFWNGSVGWSHDNFDNLVTFMNRFPGKTINERIASYVRSLGFTDGDIAHFREIMLEK